MSGTVTTTLLANAVTGNADAINGLPIGTTTPNPSTRTAFQQAVGLLNTPVTIGTNTGSTPLAYNANGTLTSTASTVTGVNQTIGTSTFNGSSAITGANLLGLSNSDIRANQNIGTVATDGTFTASNLTASAAGTANSTSSAVTASSSAAVVDVAAAGLFNSLVNVGQSAGTLTFSGKLTGNANASGVTVGSVTAPTAAAPALSTKLTGTGVNSILNLNARGLSPQTQYFQDPISPFFAEFSGLPQEPNTFGTNALFNNNTNNGTGTASTAVGIAVAGQATVGGQVLFDATTGEAITGLAPNDAFTNASTLGSNAVLGGTVSSVAAPNQLIDASGELLFTTSTVADQNSTTAATFTSPAGSGNINIAQDGNVTADASALGTSKSSNTTGDTNAFAGIFSAGATLVDDITIGRNGNITGSSNVGFDTSKTDVASTPADERVVPIETSSTTTTGSSSALSNILSIGLGTSAVRRAVPTSNDGTGTGTAALGSVSPIEPAKLDIGQDGNVTSTARAMSVTNSKSTTGDVVAFTGGLTGSGGNTFATSFNPGNALTVGLFNLDINGVGHNNVTSNATSGFVTDSNTTTGDAKSASTTITAGIFGSDTSAGGAPANTDLSIVNGNISSVASATNLVRSRTITGNASASAFNTVVGIGNTTINVAGSGSITATANLTSRAGTLT
jgi:hypothetical protein